MGDRKCSDSKFCLSQGTSVQLRCTCLGCFKRSPSSTFSNALLERCRTSRRRCDLESLDVIGCWWNVQRDYVECIQEEPMQWAWMSHGAGQHKMTRYDSDKYLYILGWWLHLKKKKKKTRHWETIDFGPGHQVEARCSFSWCFITAWTANFVRLLVRRLVRLWTAGVLGHRGRLGPGEKSWCNMVCLGIFA